MPERTLALLVAAILMASCGEAPAQSPPRGDELYATNCQACHGEDGKGTGPLSIYLLPRPRNFVNARYRITSTLQKRPTDEDLLRTLRRGFPGTAMPSFGHLPDADLLALVAKVKSFASRPIDASRNPAEPATTGPIPIPPEPPDTPESRERGGVLYAAACAPCHGATGHGDGQQAQLDELDLPTWPRNFAMGEWKGGSDGKEIYRRIVGGMSGSPMPSADLAGDDGWHVVHWVRARSDLDEKGRNEQRRLLLRAARVPGEAPLDGDDAAWSKGEEAWVALMPLWMRRTPRIQGLRAAALHDGTRLSVRLRWEDATRDDSTFGQREFRDGASLQFAAGKDPPFFGMGGGAKPGEGPPVSLLMWKADRQADAGGGNDLESRFPDAGADGYPADRTAAGAVVPGLPLSGHDPLYLTGKAAGNGVSDLSGTCPAESLSARGAGTLGFRAGGAAVEARGTWKDGTWTVVIRRTLADGGPGGVPLVPGGTSVVAFALWNGSDRDRNGIKSMTAWHDLAIEEGGR